MIRIKGESLKEWNKRVKNYKWDTSGWIQLPEIKEAKVSKKKRIEELELQVDALTNALSDLDDRYMNSSSHARTIRCIHRKQLDNTEKNIVNHRTRLDEIWKIITDIRQYRP